MPAPILYAADMMETICQRIAAGETLVDICQEPQMPGRSTIYEWVHKYPDFARRYAAATEIRADSWADDIVAIADETAGKTFAGIAAARMRIAVRQWLMARTLPHKYGDRLVPTQDGAQDSSLIEQTELLVRTCLDQMATAKALASASANPKDAEGE